MLASAVWTAVRGGTGAEALRRVVGALSSTPALVVLAAVAVGGLGSRVVVGYLAPGAYAEEVLASRAFLEARHVYGGDARADFAQWLREEPVATDPWTLPGVSSCQASALEHRPQFFTNQAHSPLLLLGSVPLVGAVGGRGLYVAILVLSLAALWVVWLVLSRAAGLRLRSREAALLLLALTGWQPVLAGVRQGDAVLLVAALVVTSWSAARARSHTAAGAAAGLAGALSLAAIPTALGFVRWPRALLAALGAIAAAAAATTWMGGPLVLPDFARTVSATARVYAEAMPNYALAGRMAGRGSSVVLVAVCTAAAIALSWWRSRTPERACATFAALGLLVAPLAWSQHLTLALVPLATLLALAGAARGAWPLALWATVALSLSLPDPAVAIVSSALQGGNAAAWPLVPFALLAVWAWLVVTPAAPRAPGSSPASVAP